MSERAAEDRRETVPSFAGLEVATLAADTLRASVRVTGSLSPGSVSLLTSVLRTHIAAGRRYLRVDLDTARICEPAVVDALVASHRTVADLGGMLVFENAGPHLIDAVRNATLFLRP